MPDIICNSFLRGEVGFELVEILDERKARRLGSALKAKQALWDSYLALPREKRAPLKRRSIVVMFEDRTPIINRERVTADILEEVGRSPADFDGELAVSPALKNVVRRIRVRPTALPDVLIDVSSFGSYRDPSIERLERKLRKTYTGPRSLELVAYYDLQDSLPIEIQREGIIQFLKEELGASPFRRVWIYGHREHRVLLAFPPWRWGCLGCGTLRRRL